jgi:hypothetical protein
LHHLDRSTGRSRRNRGTRPSYGDVSFNDTQYTHLRKKSQWGIHQAEGRKGQEPILDAWPFHNNEAEGRSSTSGRIESMAPDLHSAQSWRKRSWGQRVGGSAILGGIPGYRLASQGGSSPIVPAERPALHAGRGLRERSPVRGHTRVKPDRGCRSPESSCRPSGKGPGKSWRLPCHDSGVRVVAGTHSLRAIRSQTRNGRSSRR